MTTAEAAAGPFQVTVQPSGRTFSANADEALLAAAIRQGIGLPYGCKDGACGSCKCRKLEGEVVHRAHQSKALSAEEEASGFILTCSATALSDVVLESRQVTDESAFPIKNGSDFSIGIRRLHSLKGLDADQGRDPARTAPAGVVPGAAGRWRRRSSAGRSGRPHLNRRRS